MSRGALIAMVLTAFFMMVCFAAAGCGDDDVETSNELVILEKRVSNGKTCYATYYRNSVSMDCE